MLKGRRFTPLMIVAMIALAVALSGTAVAGTAKLITSGQIANGTITLADITRRQVGAEGPARRDRAQGRAGCRALGSQGATGAKGELGAMGPAGAKGDKGDTGTSGYEVQHVALLEGRRRLGHGPGVRRRRQWRDRPVACSAEKVALGGGYRFTSAGDNGFHSQALSDGSGVIAPSPAAWTGARRRSSRTTTPAGSCRLTTR